MPNLMKTIFDAMRKNPDFRTKVKHDIAPLGEDVILHAVDCNDRIGDLVHLASTRKSPLYIFVFKGNSLERGFSLNSSSQDVADDSGEPPAPIHPNAPVGMVLDHAETAGSLSFVVFADDDNTSTETHASRLVMS